MERTGVCMGCHQNMADEAFWNDQVIAKFGEVMSDEEHIDVMNEVIQASVAAPEVGAAVPAPAPEPTAAPEAEAVPAPGVGQDALNAVEVKAVEAGLKAAEAEAKAAEAELKAAEAEARVAEVQTALAEAPEAAVSAGGNMTMWVIVAMVLGLVIGAGIVYFARQK
jgi:hypothetical protein